MLPKIKKKEIVTLENCNSDHMFYVREMQKEFSSEIADDIRLNSTWNILRFLNARNFDIQKSKKMFREYLQFRK